METIFICSILIASLALITTFWQGIVTRKHNRLSVTPSLKITRHYFEFSKIIFDVKNCGIGPAFIKSYQINVNGQALQGSGISMSKSLCKLLHVDHSRCMFYYPDIDEAISPGENINLIIVDYSNIKNSSLPKGVISDLGFSIGYRSIYGKSYSTEYKPMVINAG